MKSLLRSGCALVALVGLPTGVWAQTESDQSARGAPQVEEIVVTAQKREQRLQDVPIAITAVSADSAQRRRITAIADLDGSIPALQFKKSGPQASPFIRGVGSTPINAGDESNVAIYVDGVLQASPGSGLFSLNNIERIEVLKGPQGTLFGRNATGGVLNIITRTPGQTPRLEASAGYANYDTVEGTLYASTPISSNAAIDVALFGKHQDDGWGRNIVNGRPAFRDKEFAARTKLVVDLGERTNVALSAAYRSSSDTTAASYHAPPGERSIDGTPSPGFYNTNTHLREEVPKLKHYDFSLRLKHDMDWASLVSISAYQHTKFDITFDPDGSPVPLVTVETLPIADWAITQELQLLSPKGSRLQWLIGGFYMKSKAF